jgi:hypothetical protein
MFTYAAVMKFAQYDRAGSSLLAYNVLPPQLGRLGGYVLPWIELAAGVAILFNQPGIGGVVSAALGVTFAYSSFRVLRRGVPSPCGCTGGRELVTRTTLLRACGITAAGVLVASSDGLALPAFASAVVAVAAVVPGVLTLRARQVARPSRTLRNTPGLAFVHFHDGEVRRTPTVPTGPAGERAVTSP